MVSPENIHTQTILNGLSIGIYPGTHNHSHIQPHTHMGGAGEIREGEII